MPRDRKVSYYYDPEIGNFYYGPGHPMKPHRVRMAHSLIVRYGLHRHMEMYRPTPSSLDTMATFHDADYIDFLNHVTPDKVKDFEAKMKTYGLDHARDCPVFDNLFQYTQLTTGASIGGATRLNYRMSDIVINWSGGLHHAKKAEASGFCYVNDIVLSILELLKYHARVLYVDIDVHHGDGVEEAFLTTPRVLTVSFHKHDGVFFPGTGDITDVGIGAGRHYAINVPLKDGIDDESYERLFQPIMTRIMERYMPEVVVLQSGADSLSGDRLGVFNLSSRGHASCHRFMAAFGIPLLVLGGGGYKINNVARCWAYETGVLLGVDEVMDEALPPNEYYEYYGPDYSLHVPADPAKENCNKKDALDKVLTQVLQNLSYLSPVSVPFHERAPDALPPDAVDGQQRDQDEMMNDGNGRGR